MKNIIALNIAFLLTAFCVFCAIELVLLHDNFLLQSSISSIIEKAHFLKWKTHLLVLGFLPIYISFIIFGSASVGFVLGSCLQNWFQKNHDRKNWSE